MVHAPPRYHELAAQAKAELKAEGGATTQRRIEGYDAVKERYNTALAAAIRNDSQTTKEANMATEHRLYFGMTRNDGLFGGKVSDGEFDAFIHNHVAPRLPEGYTLLEGQGQWQVRSGAVKREQSRILVRWESFEDAAWPAEIAAVYCARFAQECVGYTKHTIQLEFLG